MIVLEQIIAFPAQQNFDNVIDLKLDTKNARYNY